MSRAALQGLLVTNAVIIIFFAIGAWAGDYLPLALLIAVVAGMVTQIVVVVRPIRQTPPVGAPDEHRSDN